MTPSWTTQRAGAGCALGLTVLLLVLSSLFVAACGSSDETTTSAGGAETTASASSTTGASATTGAGQAGGAQVVIQDYKYVPAEITIKAGESVTWTNQDTVEHNAAADENAFEGPLLSKGETYTFTFAAPGTYPYHCTPHPFMQGVVIVE